MKAGVSKEEAAKAWHLHPFRQMASLSAVLSSLMQYGASRAYHKFSQKSDYTPEQDAELNRYKKAYTHLLSGKIGDVADQADSAYTSRQQLMGHLKQEFQHDQTQRQIDNIRQNRYNETGEGASYSHSVKEVENLMNSSTPGRRTKGKSSQYERQGNLSKATEEFYSLHPSPIRQDGETTIGLLPDGRIANVRSYSSSGLVTLEIFDPKTGKSIKFRYKEECR